MLLDDKRVLISFRYIKIIAISTSRYQILYKRSHRLQRDTISKTAAFPDLTGNNSIAGKKTEKYNQQEQ